MIIHEQEEEGEFSEQDYGLEGGWECKIGTVKGEQQLSAVTDGPPSSRTKSEHLKP